MAIELKEIGLIEKIFPVMVGSLEENGHYSDFFRCNLQPVPPDIKIRKLEEALEENFKRLEIDYDEDGANKSRCLGAVMSLIFKQQGGFIRGDYDESINNISYSVHKMCHGEKAAASFDGQAVLSEEQKLRQENVKLNEMIKKVHHELMEYKSKIDSPGVGLRGVQEVSKSARDKSDLIAGWKKLEQDEISHLTESLSVVELENKALKQRVHVL